MSHIDHPHAATSDPVEGDGVNYRGIGWFLVVLVVTVVAAQLVVWAAYEWFDYRVSHADAPRAVMAEPQSQPALESGRLVSGAESSPQPALLVQEPHVLREFNRRLDAQLQTYGWIDQNLGTVRLPIDRAKDVVLARGLPVRPAPSSTPEP